MNTPRIKNWKEFEEKINDVNSQAAAMRTKHPCVILTLLFRGQDDAGDDLNSTLDRIKQGFEVKKYLGIIERIKSSVESLTSLQWSFDNIEKEINEIEGYGRFTTACYQYMTYLRHHGFPSPLLDWTKSPYIALFFAFNKAKEKDVAIFSYFDHIGQGRTWDSRDASIRLMGPNVTTHKRHHLQQCAYTFCIKGLAFAPHQEVFNLGKQNQDLLEKYIIPISEKRDFLNRLNLMNINAYSLFGTEEGIMDKLANEEFVIKDNF